MGGSEWFEWEYDQDEYTHIVGEHNIYSSLLLPKSTGDKGLNVDEQELSTAEQPELFGTDGNAKQADHGYQFSYLSSLQRILSCTFSRIHNTAPEALSDVRGALVENGAP